MRTERFLICGDLKAAMERSGAGGWWLSPLLEPALHRRTVLGEQNTTKYPQRHRMGISVPAQPALKLQICVFSLTDIAQWEHRHDKSLEVLHCWLAHGDMGLSMANGGYHWASVGQYSAQLSGLLISSCPLKERLTSAQGESHHGVDSVHQYRQSGLPSSLS